MTVRPNPVSRELLVSFEGAYGEKRWMIELLDPTGRKVRRTEGMGSSTPSIDVRGLESGIYFLRMRSFDGSSNLTEQVVVEKE